MALTGIQQVRTLVYYSLRWDAVQIKRAVKYTFRAQDADERLGLGKLASWNQYTWHSVKPQAKADDAKK